MNDGTNSVVEQRDVEDSIAEYLESTLNTTKEKAKDAARTITQALLASYRPDLLVYDTPDERP